MSIFKAKGGRELRTEVKRKKTSLDPGNTNNPTIKKGGYPRLHGGVGLRVENDFISEDTVTPKKKTHGTRKTKKKKENDKEKTTLRKKPIVN